MIDLNFQRLKQFDGDRAVVNLENNVSAVFDRVALQALGKLRPTNLKTSAYAAALGELVVANGTFAVTLPVATAKNQGEVVGILVQSGTVTTRSLSKVQGAALGTGDALSTAGLYLYVSTGVDWWRAPTGGVSDGDKGDIIVSGGGTVWALDGASPTVGMIDFTRDVGKGYSGTFDITGLSGLVAGKNVRVVQTAQPIASKGNARDEFEMDAIALTGYVLNATTIRVYWNCKGIAVGTYAFAYTEAA